jgi:hypothetical protein
MTSRLTRSEVVSPATHGVARRPEQAQSDTYHQQDQANDPEDVNCGYQAEQQQDDAQYDHVVSFS